MSTDPRTAQVSLPSDREVEVTRAFAAPRELVFEAYTTPALVKRWLLGPPGWTMPVCEMDVRVGGTFRWRWRSESNGSEFGFHGRFLDVTPPSTLRHTEAFDPGDLDENMGDGEVEVTVRFAESDDETTVTTLIRYASKEDRDAAVSTGMTDGMEMSYKLLDKLIAEGAAG